MRFGERELIVETAKIREGDSVVRKSCSSDLIFRVMCVDCDGPGGWARLKGLNVRLVADAPVSDLELADERAVIELRRETMRQSAELVRAARMRMQQEEQARSKKERRRSVFGLARALGAAATADDRFSLPGKVLHIDGDADYLRDCMRYYKDLGVPAVGSTSSRNTRPTRWRTSSPRYRRRWCSQGTTPQAQGFR